jgi:hypothetical protein
LEVNFALNQLIAWQDYPHIPQGLSVSLKKCMARPKSSSSLHRTSPTIEPPIPIVNVSYFMSTLQYFTYIYKVMGPLWLGHNIEGRIGSLGARVMTGGHIDGERSEQGQLCD